MTGVAILSLEIRIEIRVVFIAVVVALTVAEATTVFHAHRCIKQIGINTQGVVTLRATADDLQRRRSVLGRRWNVYDPAHHRDCANTDSRMFRDSGAATSRIW